MKKVIVITGGSGFVGSNLVHYFLNQGHRIHILVRKGYRPWRIQSIHNHIETHICDLQDKISLSNILKKIAPDWIFHTAVYGAYASQSDLSTMISTNMLSTTALVEASIEVGFESFINTGSSSEYGLKDHAPHEQEWIDPNSHYALTKAYATQFCRLTSLQQKLPITSLRLYSVYGPYEEPTRLFPTLIGHLLRKKLPPLVNPSISRDYVYIDDIVRAYEHIATTKDLPFGTVYNVASGKQTSLRSLVSQATRLLPVNEKPRWGSMPNRAWDTSTWIGNASSLRHIGWKPYYSLHDGLVKMIEWQRNWKGSEYDDPYS